MANKRNATEKDIEFVAIRTGQLLVVMHTIKAIEVAQRAEVISKEYADAVLEVLKEKAEKIDSEINKLSEEIL